MLIDEDNKATIKSQKDFVLETEILVVAIGYILAVDKIVLLFSRRAVQKCVKSRRDLLLTCAIVPLLMPQ
jgi:hypothetical protein